MPSNAPTSESTAERTPSGQLDSDVPIASIEAIETSVSAPANGAKSTARAAAATATRAAKKSTRARKAKTVEKSKAAASDDAGEEKKEQG